MKVRARYFAWNSRVKSKSLKIKNKSSRVNIKKFEGKSEKLVIGSDILLLLHHYSDEG
jgi:hypothetical protein